MPITNEQFEEMNNKFARLDKRLQQQERKFDELFNDVQDRLTDSNNISQALTETVKQLLVITKKQREIFQKSMLWIAGVFSGMHYISAAEGLKIIIEESKDGDK